MVEHEHAKQQSEPGQQPKPTTDGTDGELSDARLDQVAGGFVMRTNKATPD